MTLQQPRKRRPATKVGLQVKGHLMGKDHLQVDLRVESTLQH